MFIEKNPQIKWTHTVQPHVIQGSTVVSRAIFTLL